MNLLITEPKGRSVERCLRGENFSSERDLLEFARDTLDIIDYQELVDSLRRGYLVVRKGVHNAHLGQYDFFTAHVLYAVWCHIFRRPKVSVSGDGSVTVKWSSASASVSQKTTADLTPNQVNDLKDLGWILFKDSDQEIYLEGCKRPVKSVEAVVREALEILEAPFTRGLPELGVKWENCRTRPHLDYR